LSGPSVTTPIALEQHVIDLRRAFDRSFAGASLGTVDAAEDLLAIRVAGDPYALRLTELSGLAAARRIAALPSRNAAVTGIAGIRGSLIPVCSLAVLLGYSRGDSALSWLALSRGVESMALGFEQWEGVLRVRREDVHAVDSGEVRPHVQHVARVGELARPVIDVRAAVLALKVNADPVGPSKEH
jgi:chemotaxis signal transduction protein